MKKRFSWSSFFMPKSARAETRRAPASVHGHGGSSGAIYAEDIGDPTRDVRNSGNSVPIRRHGREKVQKEEQRRKEVGNGNSVPIRRESVAGADAAGKRGNSVQAGGNGRRREGEEDGGGDAGKSKKDGGVHRTRGKEAEMLPSAKKHGGVVSVSGERFGREGSVDRKGDAATENRFAPKPGLVSGSESISQKNPLPSPPPPPPPVSEDHQNMSAPPSRLFPPKLLLDLPDFTFTLSSFPSSIAFHSRTNIDLDYGASSAFSIPHASLDHPSLPSSSPSASRNYSMHSNSSMSEQLRERRGLPRNEQQCGRNDVRRAAEKDPHHGETQEHLRAEGKKRDDDDDDDDDEQMSLTSRMNRLISGMQSEDVGVRRDALMELRLLAKYEDDKRLAISNAGALKPLVELLRSTDPVTQQEATTTLLNVSLNPTLKSNIIEAGGLEPLVSIIRQGLTSTAMANATIALVNLMGKDDEAKAKVGDMGVILPLLQLLSSGSARAKKDAATALYSLSSLDENKRRMVRGGATRVLLDFISEDGLREAMVEKSMAILRSLVCIEEGRVAFVADGGLELLHQTIQAGSRRSKELSLDVLLIICRHSSKHRTLVLRLNPLPALLVMLINQEADSRLKLRISEAIDVLETHKLSSMKQTLHRSLP